MRRLLEVPENPGFSGNALIGQWQRERLLLQDLLVHICRLTIRPLILPSTLR
jgi:hypothetical protein